MQLALSSANIWTDMMRSQEAVVGPAPPVADLVRTATYNENIAAYLANQQRGLELIAMNVSDHEARRIRRAATGMEAWNIFSTFYQRQSLESQVRIRRQLYGTTLSYGGDMREHLDFMSDLIDQLAEVGVTLSDADQIGAITMSLSREYDGLVTAFDLSNVENLTLSSVTSRLIDEYDRRHGNRRARTLQMF